MFSSNTTQISDGGYQISRSLRFNSADSAYLTRGFSSGNRKTFTWSAWIKKTTLDVNNTIYSAETNTSNQFWIAFGSANTLVVFDYQGAYNLSLTSTPLYRDFSAWYHIVVAVDTTQATSTNRAKVYVNGLEITVTGTYPTQNYDTMVNNSASTAALGRSTGDGRYLNSYMTEVNFIDGQALTPSSFGETNAQTGVWQPKAFLGTYGTNGFYVNFSDNSNTTAATLGKDYSGNGNNWTPNNFSVTAGVGNDSMVDVPTPYGSDTGAGGEVRGNYCTFNPLFTGGTLANGNLDFSAATAVKTSLSTIALPTSGKWYWEVTVTAVGNSFQVGIGGALSSGTNYLGSSSDAYAYASNAVKYNNGSSTAYGASYTTNDVIAVAYDADAGTLVFYKNNTSQGTAFSSLSGTFFPAVSYGSSSGSGSCTINFGQRAFAYTAPSGYKALCTQNLPTPTIGATTATQANKYFDTTLYTGTGSTLAVTNAGGFQPDLVWGKNRTSAVNHGLIDSVRGVSRWLGSNVTDAEGYSPGFYVTAFNSGGFTVGDGSVFNTSGNAYVGWQWKANGAGVTNTAGSITSTVSANTTSGFSVVTYTGAGPGNSTVGHGLGVAPSMIIMKNRDRAIYWIVYTATTGINNFLRLNTTDISTAGTGIWGTSAPTSTVFGGAGTDASNGYIAGEKIVAYCFAPIAGYSAFGSYTGNGSADGPFVYTGFRPAFMMIKFSSTTGDWALWDTKRAPYNAFSYYWPTANTSNAEASNAAYSLDILSNGFKIRGGNDETNLNGQTLIFMAFAESPFKYSLAR
jgi:hypothetical protein